MTNCREWMFFPIEMPIDANGNGPATIGKDAVKTTYEVWDQSLTTYASFDYLPDAINEAMRRNQDTRATPVVTDAMVEAACDVFDGYLDADTMRAALEAALEVRE